MTLAELVDLEAQLAQDTGLDREVLHARDRALIEGARTRRPQRLIAHWLRALADHEPSRAFPGRRVEGAVQLVSAVLVVLGALLGWGSGTVALVYTGDAPVNVWDFVLAFVGVQLALLTLSLVAFFAPRRSLGVPFVGLLRGLVRKAWRAVAFRAPKSAERSASWEAVLGRLKARQRLYADVETWSLFALTQTFAVAFNLGAAFALMRLVVFSDLAFAWSTTLDVDAAAFHGAVDALAAPFGWLFPDAVPTRALVEATRYSRLQDAYMGGAGPIASGAWWPFLLLSLVTYGLAPRLLLLLGAVLRRRWLLAHMPFDDVEVRALLSRLSRPHVSTHADAPEAPGPVQATDHAPRAGHLAAADDACHLVLWRDVPPEGMAEAVRAHLGCTVGVVHEAGGRDAAATERAWAAIAESRGPVVVAAEAWEAPDDAVLEFLAHAREAAGERRTVIVLLSGAADEGPSEPTPADADAWSRRLSRLADPYLAVEPLGAQRGEEARP